MKGAVQQLRNAYIKPCHSTVVSLTIKDQARSLSNIRGGQGEQQIVQKNVTRPIWVIFHFQIFEQKR